MHSQSQTIDQIYTLLKARTPYIWVTTYEEHRFISTIYLEIAEKLNKELWTWSSYQGLIRYENTKTSYIATGEMDKTANPVIALNKILEYKNNEKKNGSIWILKDFHTVLQPQIARQMRDFHHLFLKDGKNIIVVAPTLAHGAGGTKTGIEPTLDKQFSVVHFELPTKKYIEETITTTINHIKEKHKDRKLETELNYSPQQIENFACALQGLTDIEINKAMATSLCGLKRIDEKQLLNEKKQIIAKSEILEYLDTSIPMEDVGGLDLAKDYFKIYSKQFTKEAKEYGVEPLRGVLLTGIPGSGKSLISKAIATEWKLPLLRLDVGRVMSSLVGSSEEKMRTAIAQAISVSPCVLQIDEIEKSLSGTKSSGNSDGGTLSRVFGTLLTAMEEKMQGVVILATANDIQALPPELIRRFNEVMFVDLPVPEEREEIFKIHFAKRGRNIDKLNLDIKELVAATHMFTGSEIEKAVKESIARAFQAEKKDVTQEDIYGAIQDTKCIAKIMKDKIDAIREWARDKARYASSLAAKEAGLCNQKVYTSSGKALNLKDDLDNLEEIKIQAKKEKSNLDGALNQFDNILED